MFKPEGVYYAMLTPFKDGKVYEKTLRQIVEFDIQHGVNGLFPISTSGEFIQMDFNEKVRIMSIVADQAKGRVAVTPGVTAPNARECIALANEAEKLGCNAVVVSPPYYIPITQGMVETHVKTVAANVNIPVMLYNIPSFTSAITLETLDHLLALDNVVAMKDSTGSMMNATHIVDIIERAGRGDSFSFFTGREDAVLPALALGAGGCVTATSGITPEIMSGLWKAWQAGNYAEAKKIQYSMLEMIRVAGSLPLPVGLKLSMEIRGFDMGELMQPLSPAEMETVEAICPKLTAIMQGLLGDKLHVDVDSLL